MKIELLYPEICNLYGEPQNAYYLARCCPELEVAETRLGSRPLFLEEPVALVYLGTTTEQGLRLVTDALRPYRQEIAAKIDAGQLFLATGNAQDMLLERIESDRAETVEGLGLLPGHAAYHMLQRHNSFFLGKLGDMDIVGFKSIFGHTYGAGEENGLFTAVRGVGRNMDTPVEGFRRGGLMATYLIGPLLVLNPPFTKWLLRQMGCPDTLAFEEASMAAYRERIAEFSDTSKNFLG